MNSSKLKRQPKNKQPPIKLHDHNHNFKQQTAATPLTDTPKKHAHRPFAFTFDSPQSLKNRGPQKLVVRGFTWLGLDSVLPQKPSYRPKTTPSIHSRSHQKWKCNIITRKKFMGLEGHFHSIVNKLEKSPGIQDEDLQFEKMHKQLLSEYHLRRRENVRTGKWRKLCGDIYTQAEEYGQKVERVTEQLKESALKMYNNFTEYV